MKTLSILLTLIFTVMVPSPSLAEWKKLGENVNGNTVYVDFERIRKHDGYVYFWDMIDYLKPTEHGHLSNKAYRQGDCKLFRYKYLSGSFHKEPMGGGSGGVSEPPERHKGWKYPPPDSTSEHTLKTVCAYAK